MALAESLSRLDELRAGMTESVYRLARIALQRAHAFDPALGAADVSLMQLGDIRGVSFVWPSVPSDSPGVPFIITVEAGKGTTMSTNRPGAIR